MIITFETLKNDEANILAQINQLQGALAYNRQQQEFLKKQEEQKSKTEPEPQPE
jgi:uncharacterized membrane protein YgaE (UPF0421/DUF939 family)